MGEFFNRDFKLSIGLLSISARDQDGSRQPLLKVQFKLDTSGAATPNKGTIQIYNLSENSRTKVQEKGAQIDLEAGYSKFIRTIFRGQVHFGRTIRQGPNWVTKIEALDGGTAYKTKRINENLAPGTLIGQVLKKAGEAMGVDLGNLSAKVSAGSSRDILTEWTNGGVLTGKASAVMDKVCGSMGLQWSIQRGALQILEPDEVIETAQTIPVLTPATGLIGSPEVSLSGLVTLKTLLNGDLVPGARIEINSEQVQGAFKIIQAGHSGDTWGDDWTTSLEAQPLG